MTETQAGTDPNATEGTAADADGGVVDTTAPSLESVRGDAPDTSEPEPAAEAKEPEKSAEPDAEPKEIEPFRLETPEAMAEGFVRDEAVFEKAADVMREQGLSSEVAQNVVNELWPYMFDRVVESEAEAARQLTQEAMQHPKFGGDAYEENMASALKGAEAFGSEKFVELVKTHPLGQQVDVLMFLKAVSETVSEDSSLVTGGPAGEGDLSDPKVQAGILYQTSAQQAR